MAPSPRIPGPLLRSHSGVQSVFTRGSFLIRDPWPGPIRGDPCSSVFFRGSFLIRDLWPGPIRADPCSSAFFRGSFLIRDLWPGSDPW